MRSLIKLIKIIFLIVFIIIVCINISVFSSIYIEKSEYPKIFGYTYFEVLTGSMKNEINEHDIIIVKLDNKYETGDIVTYKSNNSYITHRIIEIEGNTLITKGDANNVTDTPIGKERIIGRVVKILSGAGIIIKVLTDKTMIVLSFAIIILLSYIASLCERRE